MRITRCFCAINPMRAAWFLPTRWDGRDVNPGCAHDPAMEPIARPACCRGLSPPRDAIGPRQPCQPPAAGESQLRVLPTERAPSKEATGTPLPDSRTELPPVIRRAEVVAFALVALLVICIIAVLYFAKAFFLPVVAAFVVGTMLSPAANFLERRHIPRSLAAVLIVAAVGAIATFIVGLISSPLMEWSHRLPELGSILKERLHVFDRPLALWQELQGMVGGSDPLSSLQMPKF